MVSTRRIARARTATPTTELLTPAHMFQSFTAALSPRVVARRALMTLTQHFDRGNYAHKEGYCRHASEAPSCLNLCNSVNITVPQWATGSYNKEKCILGDPTYPTGSELSGKEYVLLERASCPDGCRLFGDKCAFLDQNEMTASTRNHQSVLPTRSSKTASASTLISPFVSLVPAIPISTAPCLLFKLS
ncbi:hypothetical protein CEK26_003782 [Fusarium fujikuroi]|nr:hypothetical protein CEK27_003771 [Fusarium fujikuroi]QGJ02338.1 hypothetical protein CEK26_003782 [Fusarium fujikuroi]